MNRLFIFFIFLCFTQTTLAQSQLSISTINPDSLFVCGQDTLWFTVTNTSAGVLSNTTSTLELPSGVEYVSGSVIGATEANISNLNSPIFGIGNMQAGAAAQVRVLVRATCDLVEAINGGQLFFHKITATSGAISEQFTSTQYRIETGLLIISSVTPTVITGSLPQTIQRTITVVNTRLGRIGNLRFMDQMSAKGFSVGINSLVDTNALDTVYEALAGGAYISSFGNNDPWLDQNETLTFVEDITITGCRDTAYEIRSNIRIFWGCDSTVCAYDSAVAFVRVEPSMTNPNLVFEGELVPFNEQCGQDFTWQYLTITNAGSDAALGTIITIVGTDSLIALDGNNTQILQNGVWTNLPPALLTQDLKFKCQLNPPLNRTALFNLGDITPGTVLQLRFAMYACVWDSCTNARDSIPIDYFYRRACPANSVVSDRAHMQFDPEKFAFTFQAVHDLEDCFRHGDTRVLEFETEAPRLTTFNGFYKVQIELPVGLALDTSGACIPIITNNNLKPSSIQISPSANGTTLAELWFPTPLPDDSIRVRYCLKYLCDPDMYCWNREPLPNSGGMITVYLDSLGQALDCESTCALWVKAKAGLVADETTPMSCAFGACDDFFIVVQDTCTSGAGVPLPGDIWPVGMIGTYNVYRTNYDCEDNNNDQTADSTNPAVGPGVDIRRFIPGDTLRLDLRGVVVLPGAVIEGISFKTFHENLTSDFLVADGDSFRVDLSGPDFCDRDNIKYVSGRLIIKRTNGAITECPLDVAGITDRHLVHVLNPNVKPDDFVEDLSTMDHLTNANFTACDGPLLLGDSCIILLDWQIKENILPWDSDTTFGLFLMNFRTIPDHPLKQFTYLKPNPPYLCQYSGFQELDLKPQNTIRPCETSLQVAPWAYSIFLARANMFRYEVRPLTVFLENKFTVPNNLELLSAKLKALNLQTNKVIFSDVDIPFVQTGTSIDLDLSIFSSLKIDEGYGFFVDFQYGPSCDFDPDFVTVMGEQIKWSKPCFDSTIITIDTYGIAQGFFSAAPKLELTQSDTLLNINGQNASFGLSLKNIRPQTAFNPWLSVEAISGTYTNLQILRNGVALPQVGNIFQLPTVNPNGSFNLTASVNKTSCEPLVLNIYYGWGCDPVTNLNGALCNLDTIQITINSLNPELEMEITHQPLVVDMCDTTDWFEVEIYNANVGSAFDVEYSVRLPQGLTFEPGTAQIAYPTGAAFLTIANPQSLPNNVFYWNLSDLLPAISNGLPPVSFSPQNSLTIRFRARTQCGFVANSQPVFTTSARKSCGPIANTLRKPGESVKLQGLNAPYQAQISLTKTAPSGPVNCGGEVTLAVQTVFSGTPGSMDSIYLNIPSGFSYVAGSYTPLANAVAGPPNTIGGWRIAIPANLAAGTVMRFEVKLRYDNPAGCLDQTVSVQTRQAATAFCPAINAPCAVYLATGEALLNIPVATNEIQLSGFGAQLSPSVIAVELTGVATNQGNAPTGAVVVHATIDTNGNGIVDQGEPNAGPPLTLPSIAALSSDSFSIVLDTSFTFSQLCKLLIWLDPLESCLCAPVLEQFDQIQVQTVPFVSCEVQGVLFGAPFAEPGHTYSWTPSTGLSCTNCPMTTFTPGPNVMPGDAFTFVRTELTPSGCKIIYTYQAIFVNKPGISASDFTICRGESVTLNVTPAQLVSDILWTGPGITNPTQAQQLVSPTQTTTYSVTATVAQTCTGTEMVTVNVLEKDSVAISPATICTGQNFVFLGDTLSASGYYCQTRTNAAGCDSIICLQLTVLPTNTNSTVTLCEGGSVQIFDTLVNAPGQYCRMFSNQLGCDSTHCITVNLANGPTINLPDTIYVEEGDSIQLVGPNGYAAYQWAPAQTLSCSNCQSPFATPIDSLTAYVLTVTDANGCTGTIIYRVVLFPPCDAQRLEIPNGFTPNGDKENDVFRVPDQEGVEVVTSLKIFNRWGQIIFEASGANAAWDGKVDGKDAPMDMYIYHILIGCPSDGGGERVGEITVLR